MSGSPYLILETIDKSQIPLSDSTRLGRASDNTVVLRDVNVSSHHAVIKKDGAFWVIEDLNSTNGTWLNHKRVEGRAVIKEGDQIQMGSQMMRVSGFRSGGDRRVPIVTPVCSRCTKPLPDGAAFCPACGLPVRESLGPLAAGNHNGMRVPVMPTAAFELPYPPKASSFWKTRLMRGSIIAIAILALLGLLAGWWILNVR